MCIKLLVFFFVYQILIRNTDSLESIRKDVLYEDEDENVQDIQNSTRHLDQDSNNIGINIQENKNVTTHDEVISSIKDHILLLMGEMKTEMTTLNQIVGGLTIELNESKLKLDMIQKDSLMKIKGLEKRFMTFLETSSLPEQKRDDTMHHCQTEVNTDIGIVQTEHAILDCSDIRRLYGKMKSGQYRISTGKNTSYIAYCDMDTDNGGWTIFQRRYDGSENFFRGWDEYKYGFGNLSGEYWLGNEFLYEVTSSFPSYELRIDMEDFNGKQSFAKYSDFSVSSEANGYMMRIGTYSGNAGNSLSPVHNGMQFTTKDMDRDVNFSSNCAIKWHGAWWFQNCLDSHLNGKYFHGNETNHAWEGLVWQTWKGKKYSLRATKMMVRRVF